MKIDNNLYLVKYCDNKFGIVDDNSRLIVPFKYDEIQINYTKKGLTLDKTHLLDVRIGSCWGIINYQGIEVVPITFSKRIRFDNFGNCIVIDEITKYYGVVNITKGEIIPPTYMNIEEQKLNNSIFYIAMVSDNPFNTNEYKKNGYHNNYSLEFIKFGCFNQYGKLIAPFNYKSIMITSNGYIDCALCGYYEWDDDVINTYTNEHPRWITHNHELLSLDDGEKLISGFSRFIVLDKDVLGFYFEADDYNKPNNETVSISHNGWLITDSDFESLVSDCNGNYHSVKGFVYGKSYTKDFPYINNIIVNIPNIELFDSNKRFPTFIKDKHIDITKTSNYIEPFDGYYIDFFYKNIILGPFADRLYLGNETFFVQDMISNCREDKFYQNIEYSQVYIIRDGKVFFKNIYSAFTKPVNGYFLAFKKEKEFFNSYLMNINTLDEEIPILVYRDITKEKFFEYKEKDFFNITVISNTNSLKDLAMIENDVMEKCFRESISIRVISTKDDNNIFFPTNEKAYDYYEDDYEYEGDDCDNGHIGWSNEELKDAYLDAMENDLSNEWNID